jgi:hypothetical protein
MLLIRANVSSSRSVSSRSESVIQLKKSPSAAESTFYKLWATCACITLLLHAFVSRASHCASSNRWACFWSARSHDFTVLNNKKPHHESPLIAPVRAVLCSCSCNAIYKQLQSNNLQLQASRVFRKFTCIRGVYTVVSLGVLMTRSRTGQK